MKSTGIVRKVDDLGRVVIPVELRRTMNIDKGDPVEVYVDNGKIIFKKYEPDCIFCGEVENTIKFDDKVVCTECILKLNMEIKPRKPEVNVNTALLDGDEKK